VTSRRDVALRQVEQLVQFPSSATHDERELVGGIGRRIEVASGDHMDPFPSWRYRGRSNPPPRLLGLHGFVVVFLPGRA
jgi:hypothetical protein